MTWALGYAYGFLSGGAAVGLIGLFAHAGYWERWKRELEGVWLPQLKELFHFSAEELPALWDCDFLLGEKTNEDTDRYVLCEINVSSVSPFPESVLAPLARAVRARIDQRG